MASIFSPSHQDISFPADGAVGDDPTERDRELVADFDLRRTEIPSCLFMLHNGHHLALYE